MIIRKYDPQPLDLAVIALYDDGFINQLYFARRCEIEKSLTTIDGRMCYGLFLNDRMVPHSEGYIDVFPDYTWDTDYYTSEGFPIFGSNLGASDPDLQRRCSRLRRQYLWHFRQGVGQVIKLKCTKSISFQQLDNLFHTALWLMPPDRLEPEHISYDWWKPDQPTQIIVRETKQI